jgi:hypothetical protein
MQNGINYAFLQVYLNPCGRAWQEDKSQDSKEFRFSSIGTYIYVL